MNDAFFEDAAYQLDNSFISGWVYTDNMILQDIVNYNSFREIDIIPTVGYSFGKSTLLSIQAGPKLNLYRSAKGVYINHIGRALNITNDQYKTGIHISGIQLSTSLMKPINERLEIGLSAIYQKGLNISSNEIPLRKQSLDSYTLSLSIFYNL